MDDFDKQNDMNSIDGSIDDYEQYGEHAFEDEITSDIIDKYEKEARTRKKSTALDVLTFQAIVCISLVSCFLLLNVINADWASQIKELYKQQIYSNGEEVRGITDFVQDIYKTLTDTRPLNNSEGMGGGDNISLLANAQISTDLTSKLDEIEFVMPVSGTITSGFGNRESPITGEPEFHKGIDIAANAGTPIVAAFNGEVITADFDEKAGNYIKIKHESGLVSYYMHCDALIVVKSDKVFAGQAIATIGSTGQSTGPHLHFELQADGVPVNPTSLLDLD